MCQTVRVQESKKIGYFFAVKQVQTQRGEVRERGMEVLGESGNIEMTSETLNLFKMLPMTG